MNVSKDKMIPEVVRCSGVRTAGEFNDYLIDLNAWRGTLFENGLLKGYKPMNGFPDPLHFMTQVAAITLPSARKFIDKNEKMSTQLMLMAEFLTNKSPVYWLDKELSEALKKSEGLDRTSKVLMPAASMCIVLPRFLFVDPNGVEIGFILLGNRFIQFKGEDPEDTLVSWVYTTGGTEHSFHAHALSEDIKSLRVSARHSDTELYKVFSYELQSFIFKILLLLNSRPEFIEQGRYVKKLKKYKPAKGAAELWSPNFIGRNYKMKGNGNGTSHDEVTKRRMHLVRGHFHLYRCGTGRTETKIKWVEPFWRCADVSEEVA